MRNTDPNYLRIVRDGLDSGHYQANNPATLPMGISAMYDAAWMDNSTAGERTKLTEFFTIWSLLKKEAGLLNSSELNPEELSQTWSSMMERFMHSFMFSFTFEEFMQPLLRKSMFREENPLLGDFFLRMARCLVRKS